MRIGVALSGASGLQYGLRLAEVLLTHGHEVHLFATEAAAMVAHKEMGMTLSPQHPERALEKHPKKALLKGVAIHDIACADASGSSAVDALVVIPCSMNTLAKMAHGLGDRALERCAEVMLKEKRPLIVVPREAPLSLIDIRNMAGLCEAGAIILPASPGFYHNPKSMEDLIDFIVQKVLSLLKLDIKLVESWKG